jgi:hypothetical protein
MFFQVRNKNCELSSAHFWVPLAKFTLFKLFDLSQVLSGSVLLPLPTSTGFLSLFKFSCFKLSFLSLGRKFLSCSVLIIPVLLLSRPFQTSLLLFPENIRGILIYHNYPLLQRGGRKKEKRNHLLFHFNKTNTCKQVAGKY